MTRPSDKNLRRFQRNMASVPKKYGKQFVMGITIESTVKFSKVALT